MSKSTTAPLHITTLEIQNVKRIRAFAVDLEGESIILSGDNGAGKSSVLDGLLMALTGAGLEDPIRHGASKAAIKIQLSDGEELVYNVEKRITAKTRTLVVTNKAGEPIASPQAFLDSLVGSLAFDPLEFVRLGKDAKGIRAQAAMIRELTGLDTSKLDAEYERVSAERTVFNRTLKEAQAQLKELVKPAPVAELVIPEIPAPEDTEVEASASELIAKRDTLQELAKECHYTIDARDSAAEAVTNLETMVDDARKELQRLEASLAKARSILQEREIASSKATEFMPTATQLEDITQQIANVDAINASIRRRREEAQKNYRDLVAERDAALRQNAEDRTEATHRISIYTAKEQEVKNTAIKAEALSAKLVSLTEQKTEMARNAKMPVDGMTFDDAGVLINNMPFAQLSTAEQIRTSACVAMAANPALKIILIREGALVNTANLKVIMDAAKGRGYQVLLEKFSEAPGSEGLHIEDGEIIAIDGVSTKAPAEALTLE